MTGAGEALARELTPAIGDPRVLDAIAAVPRERFVGPDLQAQAYDNVALPIDDGQTISQPVVVGRMLELLALQPSDRVLDVGTGSGYHAALLARLAGEVVSIERSRRLSERAAARLAELGVRTVTCLVADGWRGLPEAAPFDAINVAAACRDLPAPLLEQLASGGRLVAPVGDAHQYLTQVVRDPDGLREQTLDPVKFVPLVPGQPDR